LKISRYISDELLKMPPQREVDHAIKFVHDSTSIAKTSYRHYFKESIELKIQLESLSNRYNIRSRKLLGDNLVSFQKTKMVF
jgi:hypothetical protein